MEERNHETLSCLWCLNLWERDMGCCGRPRPAAHSFEFNGLTNCNRKALFESFSILLVIGLYVQQSDFHQIECRHRSNLAITSLCPGTWDMDIFLALTNSKVYGSQVSSDSHELSGVRSGVGLSCDKKHSR